jgi:hypothetical protein
MYMGKRRCANVKEKKKDLQPRVQDGGRGDDQMVSSIFPVM